MKRRSPLRSPNSDAGSASDADALLAHAGFLRALTRGLLLDDQQADDIIQQTIVAAMSRQREPNNPRAWLATVARNFARMTIRSESRRTQREQTVARPESRGDGSPDATVERLEVQQRVVSAVKALDEPYRSVIVHRFFDDLSPKEIAARDGVPVKTVHTRLRRALEQLRGRLDAEHGGDRRAWALALIPGLAGEGAAAATPIGAGALLKAGLAAAAFTAVLLVWRESDSDTSASRRPVTDETVAAASTTAAGSDAAAKDGSPSEPAVKPRETVTIRGVVLDRSDTPIAGARVGVMFPDGPAVTAAATRYRSASDGTFAVPGVATRDLATDGLVLEALHPEYETSAHGIPLDGSLVKAYLMRGAPLTVLVRNPDGAAQPGARVRVFQSSYLDLRTKEFQGYARTLAADGIYYLPLAGFGTTNADGKVRPGGVPVGDIVVEVLHRDFAPKRIDVEIKDLDPRAVEVTLDHGGSVSGRVLTVDARPVAGARVRARYYPGRFATSNARGEYRLERIEPGEVELFVEDDDGRFGLFGGEDGWGGHAGLEVEAGAVREGIDIVIRRAAFLRARVIDDLGTPVSGYSVHVDLDGAEPSGRSARTDAAGAVRIGPFAVQGTAKAHVRCYGQSHRPRADKDVAVSSGGVTDAGDLIVDRRGHLAGVVLDGDGKPVAGVWVDWDGGGALTDNEGHFAGLAGPGRVQIEARGQVGGEWQAAITSRKIEVGGRAEGVEITLRAQRSISGLVTDEGGAPVPGMGIACIGEHGRVGSDGMGWIYRGLGDEVGVGDVWGTRTDKNGRFAFSHRPAGRYRVGLVDIGTGRFVKDPAPKLVETGSELRFVMKVLNARIEARVISRKTKQPLEHVTIRAYWFEGILPQRIATADVVPGAECAIDVPAPGRFMVEFRAPGHAPFRTKPLDVRGGQRLDLGDVLLGGYGKLTGIVRDSAGQPVRHVRVYTMSEKLELKAGNTMTDTEGRFVIASVTPGLHGVFLVSPKHPVGMQLGVRVDEGKTASIEVALAESAPLTITVVGEADRPIAGVKLTYSWDAIHPISSDQFGGYEPASYGANLSDKEGRIEKPFLPTGAVRLRLSKEGFVTAARIVDLSAGAPAELVVRLNKK